VCTLAIYFQVSPEYPIVVAANRDEVYARPTQPPACIAAEPWIVAGRDLVAGGTWLGVNSVGVVAGLLNRRTGQPADPTKRSRGLLCLNALGAASYASAAASIRETAGILYNPFNLLLASVDAAGVFNNVTGHMRGTALPPGVHLLTNLDLDDTECPRIAKSYRLFDAARALLHDEALPRFRAELRRILSDHSTPLDPRAAGPANNLCMHTEQFGTRSSTLLVYTAAARRFRMWHADGAPCRTEWIEVALPHG